MNMQPVTPESNVEGHGSRCGRARLQELAAAVFVGVLTIVLFHLQGNTVMVAQEGRSAFLWIVRSWAAERGDFSHGWLMPFVSLFIVWGRRHALAAATKSTCRAGLVVVLFALLVHVAAYRAQQPRISLLAFTSLVWGIALFVYGLETARILLFPCAYLCLCLLSYYLVAFSLPLRLLASHVSTVLINGIGIPAERAGTAIYSAAGGGFQFDVADACSGLRSLAVMAALSAPYAYYTQRTVLKKWLLFLFSLPLATAANVVRIVTIAVVAQAVSVKSALKLYHDFSGYFLFVLVVLLMMAAGQLLNIDYPGRFRRWKERALKHT